MSTLHKVTAYVTRHCDGATELLVFDHPLAGTQLPAGTVEPGEAPAAAVLREVAEETGVRDCRIVALLSTETEAPPSGCRVVHTASRTLRRGLYVRIRASQGTERRVEVDGYSGHHWISAGHLGDRLIRHHFHLQAVWQGPRAWSQEADGHVFRPRWVSLAPDVGLVAGQAHWLSAHATALMRSAT